ncbi:JmjC domain-containing protein 7 [Rhizophlyctis rosea]|nr:JmjC domain-containing protein 7 [Rhizophlyctis rosea]
MAEAERISKALGQLAKDARDLVGTEIMRFPAPPTPLEFMRIVAANRPVVFQHVADDWPALRKWRNTDYLEQKLGSKEITVAVTPNG